MLFLIILLFFSKIEYDTKSYYQAKYLLNPILKKLSDRIVEELSHVLRDDLALVVGKNTSSIFRYQKQINKPTLITRSNNKLRYNPFMITNKQLIFIDKESLIEYKNNHILYFGNLSSNSNLDILIDIYNVVKDYDLNCKFFEVEIYTIYRMFDKEIKIELENIGVIHETIYCYKNLVYEKLKKHFVEFYSNKKLYNLKCYVISKMYIDSLKSLFNITNIEENFPFRFFNKLCDTFNKDMIVTGGICYAKKRFIFSFLCKFNNNEINLIKI